jgi:hypothetical protein
MSSKIFQLYYLTEYSLGRIMSTWPRSRYRAINANGANTLGFRDKGMTKNPKCARVVNHLTGTRRASRTLKRQSAGELISSYRGIKTTMTMAESSEQSMTNTTAAENLRRVKPPSEMPLPSVRQRYPLSVTAGNGLRLTVHCPT